jgi:methylase of polypeptide subunit release factors
VDRVFEWCAGPGFIGFSLLAAGLCTSLTLADVNPRAVEIARRTISHNDLGQTVEVLLSDCFDSVPKGQKWDLVVGNPPHVETAETMPEIPTAPNLYQDSGWGTHRKFYEQVGEFLNDAGSIVLVENGDYSSPAVFRSMVDATPGLTWVEAIPGRRQFYFVWASRKSGSSLD